MNRFKAFRLIAVAVLLTVLGGLAVLNLTPDRRELDRPVPHAAGTSDAEFLRTMAGLYGSNLLTGTQIETLVNGDRIFPAMLDAIAAAEQSVNFETYVYWSGDIAVRFADALSERALAGVEVRVLLDWVGSAQMDPALIDRMEAAGVRVVRFRPVRWYTLTRVNNRTHRKLLVVDGRVGFTGGVGVGDEWLGDARHPDEWRETHYRVTGPVVAMMQGAFAENWVEDTGEVLQGPRHFPALEPVGDMVGQLVTSSTGSRNSIHLMLMTAIASAESHLRITSPYFVPDDVAINQLLEARARGVTVDIIVPSAHTDFALVRHASRHFWGPLLEAGVGIYEYQPTFIHAKLLIVDTGFVSVGSTNFDERSFRLNDEANLNVFNAEFAREQIEIFERDLAQSVRITVDSWERRPWRKRAGDWFWSWFRPQL
ncbi:MAG: cardiolipin synthase B [Pararhodobacter sp.]|nr:cardiolipin synthase B [Pararhodobacter sp.]